MAGGIERTSALQILPVASRFDDVSPAGIKAEFARRMIEDGCDCVRVPEVDIGQAVGVSLGVAAGHDVFDAMPGKLGIEECHSSLNGVLIGRSRCRHESLNPQELLR